jgi:hypothetical protein
MPVCVPAIAINIHKNCKYLNNQQDGERRPGRRRAAKRGAEVETLAKALRAASPVGRALRALARRVRDPQSPWKRGDLRQLLLVSLAERRNAQGR